MTKTTKTATASTASVRVQLASLATDNARLEAENKQLKEDLGKVKQINVELASVIENDLKADLKLKIMAKSDFKESDLEGKDIETLQQIEQTLLMSKPVDLQTYKSIRAGGASTKRHGLLTVGNLHGKKREDILAMGGDF